MEKPRPIPLAQELATYQAHKAELLKGHNGQFALVHGDAVLGTYHTQQDAIKDGYQRLGNVPFLTREIVEVEVPLRFTRDLFPVAQTV